MKDETINGPLPMLTADDAIEQIRAFRARIPTVSMLTEEQRKLLRNRAQTDEAIVQSSLNTIAVSHVVSTAVGQPIERVRELQREAILWKAVESEARNLLTGLAGANALRRDWLAVLGANVRDRNAGGPRSRERGARLACGGDPASQETRAPQEGAETGKGRERGVRRRGADVSSAHAARQRG